MSSLADEFRAARAASGLNQARYGELLGVSYSYVSHVENGRSTPSIRLTMAMFLAQQIDGETATRWADGDPLVRHTVDGSIARDVARDLMGSRALVGARG